MTAVSSPNSKHKINTHAILSVSIPCVSYAYATPIRTGAAAPVNVFGRAARNHAFRGDIRSNAFCFYLANIRIWLFPTNAFTIFFETFSPQMPFFQSFSISLQLHSVWSAKTYCSIASHSPPRVRANTYYRRYTLWA